MNRIVMKSKVSSDGVLHLSVPSDYPRRIRKSA